MSTDKPVLAILSREDTVWVLDLENILGLFVASRVGFIEYCKRVSLTVEIASSNAMIVRLFWALAISIFISESVAFAQDEAKHPH